VLQSSGKLDEALREALLAAEIIAKVSGERNARYGDILMLVGTIYNELEQYEKATANLARSCEIAAFQVGERSTKVAECWQHHAIALTGLGKHAEAIALAEKAMPIFIEIFGDVHPHVANAYVTRGAIYIELGNYKQAIPDLEQAVEQFTKLGDAMDSGHLGGAKWALGQAVYPSDRERGRALVEQASAHFERGAETWQSAAAEARAWLAKHR
jgi:tetratricopeptide (TPR) repeat protein